MKQNIIHRFLSKTATQIMSVLFTVFEHIHFKIWLPFSFENSLYGTEIPCCMKGAAFVSSSLFDGIHAALIKLFDESSRSSKLSGL